MALLWLPKFQLVVKSQPYGCCKWLIPCRPVLIKCNQLLWKSTLSESHSVIVEYWTGIALYSQKCHGNTKLLEVSKCSIFNFCLNLSVGWQFPDWGIPSRVYFEMLAQSNPDGERWLICGLCPPDMEQEWCLLLWTRCSGCLGML